LKASFLSNVLLNSKAALKNQCCFTPVMMWSRELAVLRKTRQLSQTKQQYVVTLVVHIHAGLISGEILCI